MNPNDSELEAQLRALRPMIATPGLEDRLAAALHPREITPHAPTAAVLPRAAAPVRWWQGLGWALAGALATLAVFASMPRHAEVGAPVPLAGSADAAGAAETFQHTESTEALVDTEDGDLVLTNDQEPAREVHFYTLERHVWTNAQTGTRMEFEIPREDVRLMPVAMQ